MTGRYSITATPGRRRKPRLRQNSPVLTATGRQGARRDVKRGDAVLVHWRRPRKTPRPLRVNEHLSPGGEHGLGGGGDLVQRLPAPPAIDRDLL